MGFYSKFPKDLLKARSDAYKDQKHPKIMIDKINALKAEIEALTASTPEEAEQLRIKYLSKKGAVSLLLNDFRNVPAEQKREIGQLINGLKTLATDKINSLKAQAAQAGEAAEMAEIDLTRTATRLPLGTRHPLSLVKNEIIDIFGRVGFTIAEGPEIEDDWRVFSSLNFAPDHPARDTQDTFFISRNPVDVLLRTHTSSVQTRVEHTQPPIRIVCPGRVYRNEAISARRPLLLPSGGRSLHRPQRLLRRPQTGPPLFRTPDVRPRNENPSASELFPFTEPSAEMDISCDLCGGKGCAFCKGTGWVEILGCGMVDPHVAEACGIDSKEYTGYAFGMGVERITNLKYRVKDLRMFSENDIRFLREFEAAH